MKYNSALIVRGESLFTYSSSIYRISSCGTTGIHNLIMGKTILHFFLSVRSINVLLPLFVFEWEFSFHKAKKPIVV